MGKIKKIIENELVGGTQPTDIYPVTSIKAVYDEYNERLDHVLNRRGIINVSTNYNENHSPELLTLYEALPKVPKVDQALGAQIIFLSSKGWVSYIFNGANLNLWTTSSEWEETSVHLNSKLELYNNYSYPQEDILKLDINNSKCFIYDESDYTSNLLLTASSVKLFSMIKDIKLIGDWDLTKSLFVEQISHLPNNLARIVISERTESGRTIIYNANNIYYTPTNGVVKLRGPELSGRQVSMVVDINQLSVGKHIDVGVEGTKLTISPITKILQLESVSSCFNLFKSPNKEEIIILNALFGVELFGDWDYSKNYAVSWVLFTNTTCRLVIQDLDSQGNPISEIFDATTTIELNKINTLLFKRGNKEVKCTIDMSQVEIGQYSTFLNSPSSIINTIVPIYNRAFSKITFWDRGTVEDESALATIYNVIKDIQLLGDWNPTKKYAIDQISKQDPRYGYRFVIYEILEDGTFINVYDVSPTITDDTKELVVEFPERNNKKVIALMDYTKMSVGYISIGNRTNHYLIPSVFSLESLEDKVHLFNNSKSIGILEGEYSKANTVLAYTDTSTNIEDITNKRGFMCFRVDDSPAYDEEFVKLLDKYGHKYTHYANVPYYDGYSVEGDKFRALQERGHEVGDHTAFHTTFFAHVPKMYKQLFDPYLGNGISRMQKSPLAGVEGYRLTFETEVIGINYQDYQIGQSSSYTLEEGSATILGDFSMFTEGTEALIYVDNMVGQKIGWILAQNRTDGSIYMTNNDGTDIYAEASETINMYGTRDFNIILNNYTLTNNATYCLLMAGQCQFDYSGLAKPLTWNQPGGVMPFMNREYLKNNIRKFGMLGGETDQTAVEGGAKATYNYYSPFPRVCTTWEGGYLHFDACDGSDYWLQNAKNLIADYVAKKNIRTMASHFRYLNFPGETREEKRINWLKWFDKLFMWLSENNIKLLTLSERTRAIEDITPNRYANIFPELYHDRAGRGKPDGYTITNPDIIWGNSWSGYKGRPESKNFFIGCPDIGNIFRIENLGGLEKGKNILRGFVMTDSTSAKLEVKTTQGLITNGWNQEEYDETNDLVTVSSIWEWTPFEIELDIPYTMNYINLEFNNIGVSTGHVFVSGLSLFAK